MNPDAYVIEPYGKHFAVYEVREHLLIEEELSGTPEKQLIAVCVYRKGAEEVKNRLTGKVQVKSRYIFWRPCCQETTDEARGLNEKHATEKDVPLQEAQA